MIEKCVVLLAFGRRKKKGRKKRFPASLIRLYCIPRILQAFSLLVSIPARQQRGRERGGGKKKKKIDRAGQGPAGYFPDLFSCCLRNGGEREKRAAFRPFP